MFWDVLDEVRHGLHWLHDGFHAGVSMTFWGPSLQPGDRFRSVGAEFPARLGNAALDEKQMKKRKMDGRSSAGRLYLQHGGQGHGCGRQESRRVH